MMNKITIEAVYATAEYQFLWQGKVNEGTTARQGLLQSDLPKQFPDVNFQLAPIGIFGKKVNNDYILCEWDRIEVYRPLMIDPKENRRRRAAHKS
ncbi:MAG: RnfH family protein [Snodgrassella sp.]|nr:RnfH family protein [Snodgrassella sp.]